MNEKMCPKFLIKLYQILKDGQYDILKWNQEGDAFEINDSDDVLVKTILSVHFKQSSFFSFIRQLNQYGFQKQKIDRKSFLFKHQFFLRDKKDMLKKIVSHHRLRSYQYQVEQRDKIIDIDETNQLTRTIQDLQLKQKEICEQFHQQVHLQLQLKQIIHFVHNKILGFNLSIEQQCFIAQTLLIKVMKSIPNDEEHQFEIELISKILQEFSNIYLEYYSKNQSQRSPNFSIQLITPLPFQVNEQQRRNFAFLDSTQEHLQDQIKAYLLWVKESYELALLRNSV